MPVTDNYDRSGVPSIQSAPVPGQVGVCVCVCVCICVCMCLCLCVWPSRCMHMCVCFLAVCNKILTQRILKHEFKLWMTVCVCVCVCMHMYVAKFKSNHIGVPCVCGMFQLIIFHPEGIAHQLQFSENLLTHSIYQSIEQQELAQCLQHCTAIFQAVGSNPTYVSVCGIYFL